MQQQYSTLFLFQQTSIRVSCCTENLHQVKFCRNKAKYKVVLGGVGARLRRTFSHMANTSEVEKVFTIITLRYCTNYMTFLFECPAGTRTRPATRYFFRSPTRFSFRNHRVAGNPKHRVLPDISGKPKVSGTTRYSGFHP